MAVCRWMIAALCLVPLAGCSGEKTDAKADKKNDGKATSAPASSPAATAASTPAVDINSGLDIDSKRVRAFSPSGWRRAPKSYDYLVRYQSTPQLAYPSVVIVAADPPEGFGEVTKDNHKTFVEAIASKLAEEFGGEGKPALLRKPSASTVGAHHAVTWLVPGEAKLDNIPKKIERECTAVVISGRMYTVEAWAPVGKIDDKAKEAARAVAAALAVPSLDAVEPSFLSPSDPAGAVAVPDAAAKPDDAKP